MISAISSVRPFGGPAATSGVGPAASGASGAGGDFTKVLADVASSTVGALKTGESTAIAGINGGKSVQQVVDAVMNAEQALQTAVAVRDKLISAYQEISRMAI
jgi:flagellar hook-basal body complex protein FliE